MNQPSRKTGHRLLRPVELYENCGQCRAIVGQATVFRGLGTWAAGPRAVMKNSDRFVGQAIVFCRLSYAARAEFSMLTLPQVQACLQPGRFFEGDGPTGVGRNDPC